MNEGEYLVAKAYLMNLIATCRPPQPSAFDMILRHLEQEKPSDRLDIIRYMVARLHDGLASGNWPTSD